MCGKTRIPVSLIRVFLPISGSSWQLQSTNTEGGDHPKAAHHNIWHWSIVRCWSKQDRCHHRRV